MAIFQIEDIKVGLQIEGFNQQLSEETNKAYGFNPLKMELEIFKIRVIKNQIMVPLNLNLEFSNLIHGYADGNQKIGHSGGPIINISDKVIGVITRGEQNKKEGRFWFISSDYILEKTSLRG